MDEDQIERELGLDQLGQHQHAAEAEPAEEDANEDVEFLRAIFMNEKVAPEILPYEADLVTHIKEQLDNQQLAIDAYKEEDTDEITEEDAFTAALKQMELDRIKYMLSSYLRIRLKKIEKYTLHILKSPEYYERLSANELNYARKYLNHVAGHFKASVLDQVPAAYGKITEESDEVNMVTAPQLDQFVFCRVTQDITGVQMDESGEQLKDMNAGDIFAVRYRPIRALVTQGDVLLI